MPSHRLWSLALLLAAAPAAGDGPGRPSPGASATLPLADLLELHDQAQEERPTPERPPFSSSVAQAALTGRLLERALDVTADFTVAVLADGWVRVPLLRLDPSVHLQSVVAPDGATVLVDGDALVLVTRTPGRHAVQVSLLKTARSEGRARRVELGLYPAAVAAMRVRFDAEMFRLISSGALRAAGEQVFYPEGGRFALAWEARRGTAAPPPGATERRPVEPAVTAAHASVVCTLDGLQLTRVVYQLRLQGAQPISLTLPPGATLARVLLNGAPAAAAASGGVLRLTAVPARSGDESARLEVVLRGARVEFHLSGRLEFAFPAVSWNTHVLSVALHLPAVFDYAWAAGSLAPAEASPEASPSPDLPLPGRVLHFRQELISSSPDVAVSYAVDLKGQYFGG